MIKYITATGTDVGKTYITLNLLKEYASRGLRVAVIKPIETGVIDAPIDGSKLLKLSKELNRDLHSITIDDVVPIRFPLPASPFVAKGETEIDFKLIQEKIEKLHKLCDVLFIEGAGGIFVPIDNKYDMTYFCTIADETILITRDKLGTISDTRAYSELLKLKNIEHKILVNLRDEDDFNLTTKAFFDTLKDLYYSPKDLNKI